MRGIITQVANLVRPFLHRGGQADSNRQVIDPAPKISLPFRVQALEASIERFPKHCSGGIEIEASEVVYVLQIETRDVFGNVGRCRIFNGLGPNLYEFGFGKSIATDPAGKIGTSEFRDNSLAAAPALQEHSELHGSRSALQILVTLEGSLLGMAVRTIKGYLRHFASRVLPRLPAKLGNTP